MANTENLFPTLVYRGQLTGKEKLNKSLLSDVESFSAQDKMGKAWSKENYREGYTSYASLSDMQFRSPTFTRFAELMQPHAKAFAKRLGWKLKGCHLQMTSCWMNVMAANTYHPLHLHPHSVISGTYYVSTPKGSSGLKIEDPRMPLYMNAPVREGQAKSDLYYMISPKAGAFVLFESWLRHEVPPNRSTGPRISISFNYSIENDEDT